MLKICAFLSSTSKMQILDSGGGDRATPIWLNGFGSFCLSVVCCCVLPSRMPFKKFLQGGFYNLLPWTRPILVREGGITSLWINQDAQRMSHSLSYTRMRACTHTHTHTCTQNLTFFPNKQMKEILEYDPFYFPACIYITVIASLGHIE